MGKIRDIFKKIRDTKGTFHAKMGTIKDKNGMELTKAEILRRDVQKSQNYTHTKSLNDMDNHNGVIIRLEPDILKCEFK